MRSRTFPPRSRKPKRYHQPGARPGRSRCSPARRATPTAFDKVYEQYRLAPEVTRRRMYYETMERVLRKTDKTIVEADGVTPYLPLPEVRRARSRSTPTTGGQ